MFGRNQGRLLDNPDRQVPTAQHMQVEGREGDENAVCEVHHDQSRLLLKGVFQTAIKMQHSGAGRVCPLGSPRRCMCSPLGW